MLSRLSCANAASESTAEDVFIFPKKWKYRIIARASQMKMNQARARDLHENTRQTCDEARVAGVWSS